MSFSIFCIVVGIALVASGMACQKINAQALDLGYVLLRRKTASEVRYAGQRVAIKKQRVLEVSHFQS